jgi:hypothetical protein
MVTGGDAARLSCGCEVALTRDSLDSRAARENDKGRFRDTCPVPLNRGFSGGELINHAVHLGYMNRPVAVDVTDGILRA